MMYRLCTTIVLSKMQEDEHEKLKNWREVINYIFTYYCDVLHNGV